MPGVQGKANPEFLLRIHFDLNQVNWFGTWVGSVEEDKIWTWKYSSHGYQKQSSSDSWSPGTVLGDVNAQF